MINDIKTKIRFFKSLYYENFLKTYIILVFLGLRLETIKLTTWISQKLPLALKMGGLETPSSKEFLNAKPQIYHDPQIL